MTKLIMYTVCQPLTRSQNSIFRSPAMRDFFRHEPLKPAIPKQKTDRFSNQAHSGPSQPKKISFFWIIDSDISQLFTCSLKPKI